jgi:hypothetical protein
MLKGCIQLQGHRLKTVSRKKFNMKVGSDTFYNAEIAKEGDLKAQLSGVLKNKISILQNSNLAEMSLYMYLRIVPNGKIVG